MRKTDLHIKLLDGSVKSLVIEEDMMYPLEVAEEINKFKYILTLGKPIEGHNYIATVKENDILVNWRI